MTADIRGETPVSSPNERSTAPLPVDGPAVTPHARYVLLILTVVYTFNFVDRQIIAILSPAIKAELGLSDSMLGLLKGLAFAILYTTLGIPIAWLADRFNRVTIVSVSLAIWSAFTAFSGFAQNALQLMLARVGVGIGEAGGTPPSHSILSDYFPKEKRASALAIYSLGIPLGQMLAFLAGGYVVQEFGWRKAFFLVGVPGVLLALVLKLTVKEPVRGAMEAKGGRKAPVKLKHGLTALLSIPTYWGFIVAVTLASFTGYGMGLWSVDFYKRTYGLSYTDITVPLGLLNGVAYALGTYLGGALVDRAALNDKRAYAWIPGVGMLVTIPAGILSLWSPTPFWAFFWTAPFLIGLGMYLGPSMSIVQTLAPITLRAFATAFYFFILNLVALGLAPLWIGALSDFFAARNGETTGLRLALSSLCISSLLAALAFFWTARKVPADWAKATGG